MKSTWMKPIGAAVLAAGLTFAYAETTPNPPNPAANRQQRQQWMQRRFDRMATALNLTDAQKAQAKAILQEAHGSAKQYAVQMRQNRQALADAVKANNTAEIERLSNEQGKLMGKMMAIHSEAFAKIYQNLTPEQRQKADQMRQQFGARMHRHAPQGE